MPNIDIPSPKISIITINFNNDIGLQKTIESVVFQTFKNLEYIIIDGGSTDGSVEVIQNYKNEVAYWVSEPDAGVYNAMNKGIVVATGEYLLFLNSGDFLVHENVIQTCIQNNILDKDIVYGDLILKKMEEIILQKKYPNKLSFDFFYNNESLPHPATFIKALLFKKVGYYNESLKIVSDWEFWLKAIFLHNASYKRIQIPVSVFNLDGMSSLSSNLNKINTEKEIVYNSWFSGFIDDYKKFNETKNEYNHIQESLRTSRIIKILKKAGLIKL